MTEVPVGDIVLGDCVEVMKPWPDNCIDAIVCDPPYDLISSGSGGFMGHTWDATGVAFRVETWAEALRIAKPGAHLLAFGGTRTVHRMMTAIEDAGWEIRDQLVWAYASGMPKSLDVSKAIDRHLGADRTEVVGIRPGHEEFADRTDDFSGGGRSEGWDRPWKDDPEAVARTHYVTAPATPEATTWNGWGTALKPSWEPIVMARKPLIGTVAANVLAHGTGGINIDATRIPLNPDEPPYVINTFDDGAKPFGGGAGHPYTSRSVIPKGREGEASAEKRYTDEGSTNFAATPGPRGGDDRGRWPANVILTDPIFDGGYDNVVGGGERSSGVMKAGTQRDSRSVDYGKMPDTATLADTYGDSGGTSRFFVIPKAARSEREPNWHGLSEFDESDQTNTVGPMAGRGQAGLRCLICGKWKVSGNPCRCPEPEWEQSKFNRPKVYNNHSTVKPLDLMCHLVRMVTPPDGIVLDPFLGSGTTAKAAELEGRRWVGIELYEHHVKIARARLMGTQRGLGL